MTREEEIASDPRVIRCTCGQSGYDEGARIIAYAGWFEPASVWVAWPKSFAAYTGPRVLRGCEPKLCAQAATRVDAFGGLELAAADGLAASAAQ